MSWEGTPASVNTKFECQESSNLQSSETEGVLHLLVKVSSPLADFNFQYRTIADGENKNILHTCRSKKPLQFPLSLLLNILHYEKHQDGFFLRKTHCWLIIFTSCLPHMPSNRIQRFISTERIKWTYAVNITLKKVTLKKITSKKITAHYLLDSKVMFPVCYSYPEHGKK